MEGRLIEYRPIGGGLDYHHNSPLIGEIPPAGGDYSHAVHRSIDHLRNSLNERVALGPLSVFSNTADLRNSVLTYSQQPQQQPPPQQQQQQQQHHPQQQHQYQLVPEPKPTITNLESSAASSAVSGSVTSSQQKHVNDPVVSSSSGSTTTASSGTAPTGSTRGRKSRIYPNPNQHIIVTSNSVDNGGIRMLNASLNERNAQNPAAGSSGGGVSATGTSGNGISSSTSSPHHMTQMDVKDTKVKRHRK